MDGSIVDKPNAIEAKKDGTLDIKMMMDSVKGNYQCKAKNDFGVAASNFTQIDMACECFFSDIVHPFQLFFQKYFMK